jgi:hypothetical protein
MSPRCCFSPVWVAIAIAASPITIEMFSSPNWCVRSHSHLRYATDHTVACFFPLRRSRLELPRPPPSPKMNYTGNPRRLRAVRRTSQNEYVQRGRGTLAVSSELPQLDVCQAFQTASSQSHASSVTSKSASVDEDTFQVKRRRLLQQADWSGLGVSAGINVSHQCTH